MKKLLLTALCSISLACLTAIPAFATDLPAGVLNYVHQKDPNVKVRFDGVVLFSNGETYVPIIPQDPSINPESQQVVMTVPDKTPYPDLVEFDNHFFLLRLIQTSSGRLTFPKLVEYPIQLKEGLLPQDFVMPPNLFIPVELKIILGALPYNPSFETPKEPPAEQLGQISGFHGMRLSYVFDLNTQRIAAIDPILGHKQAEIALDCIPSALQLNPENTLLFAPCLSTNELVVIDTGSNLVKTRVPVGQKPDSVLYLDALKAAVVSNRYSPFLSIVNTQELLTAEKVALPEKSSAGAMAAVPGDPNHLVVADAFQPSIYWVNLTTRTVEKTLKAVADISSIKVTLDAHAQPEIWVASRTADKVAVLNLTAAAPLATLDVGKKPVALVLDQEHLLVLSAGDSRLDVIDWPKRTLLEPIALAGDAFPASVAVVPSERKAYVTMAGNTEMAIVDLASLQLESTLSVEFRANMIATTPDPKAEAEQAAVIAKQVPQTPYQPPQAAQNIGPEAPKKRGWRKKSNASAQTADSEGSDAQVPKNAPKVMPVLQNNINSYGNNVLNNGFNSGFNPGLNPSYSRGYTQTQASPLNIPLSRSKSKKHEDDAPSAGTSADAPPMMDENISK